MPKRTRLEAKYKVRRTLLVLLLIVVVGGLGWLLGRRIPVGAPSDKATSGGHSVVEPGNTKASKGLNYRKLTKPTPEPEPKLEAVQLDNSGWSLILVNEENPLPSGYRPQLGTIYEGCQVDKRILDETIEMLNQAKLDGIAISVSAAYTQEETQPEAAACVTEHTTGLAIDIAVPADKESDLLNTPAYKWLCANADKYGFILRYPENRQGVTSVEFSPLHYRYVGTEHAAAIKETGYCLEEYLVYLERGPDEDSGGEEEEAGT